jgi:hypothetical protein
MKITIQLATHGLEGKTILLKETEITINKTHGEIIRFYIDKELRNEAIRKVEESIRKKLLEAIHRLK